jgi:hypothetical protein
VNSWKVILATMVIFGTGVITGGLLVKNTAPTTARRPAAANRTNQPPVNVSPQQLLRLEFLRSVRKDLDLSPEQHERIEKIIHEGQEQTRKLWDSVAPDMRKELQSVHEKIRAELSPEQRRKFELLIKNPPRPNNPENNPQQRDRPRQGNPSDPQNNPGGQPRPRRENAPLPENPPPVNQPPAFGEPQPDKN